MRMSLVFSASVGASYVTENVPPAFVLPVTFAPPLSTNRPPSVATTSNDTVAPANGSPDVSRTVAVIGALAPLATADGALTASQRSRSSVTGRTPIQDQ